MNTLVLKSFFTLSAPLADTPILPQYDPSLLCSYTPASVVAAAGKVTKWANTQGTYGNQADMSLPSAKAPAQGSTGVVFSGTDSTYISTPAFSAPMPVPVLTVLMRIKFSANADVTQGTIFSGIDSPGYAYLRRQINGTLSAGVNAADSMVTTKTCPSGVWTDLAISFNGNDTRIYINDDVTVGSTGTAGLTGLRLGANVGKALFLNAEISHLQVYSRVIGAEELQQIRRSLT